MVSNPLNVNVLLFSFSDSLKLSNLVVRSCLNCAGVILAALRMPSNPSGYRAGLALQSSCKRSKNLSIST